MRVSESDRMVGATLQSGVVSATLMGAESEAPTVGSVGGVGSGAGLTYSGVTGMSNHLTGMALGAPALDAFWGPQASVGSGYTATAQAGSSVAGACGQLPTSGGAAPQTSACAF